MDFTDKLIILSGVSEDTMGMVDFADITHLSRKGGRSLANFLLDIRK